MVVAKWFGKALEGQFSATAARRIDWATDVGAGAIKVALTTSAYSPAQDTDDFFADVSNEVNGAGYTTGGAALATPTQAYDAGTNELRLDAADTVWTTSTITAARIAVVYKDTGNAATSPLICYVDFGGDQSTVAADFTIQWDSTGVAKITAS